MRITSLKIERFGVWENLSLPKISPGLNVFFGPNEAGKTTLMQFIRTCLYGGADEDRERYIQMALDGRRRRSRKGGRVAADDPRRTAFNASFVDANDSNVPEEVRRFLAAGRAAQTNESPETPPDAKSVARDVSRTWIGGVATVSSDFGDHRIERRYIRRDASYLSAIERRSGFVATDGLINWSGRFYSLPGQKIAESLVITGPDGARVGDYFSKSLTCNLDESTYNGVFAIGLDELQRLGMLNETEAAQMLYRLSVGVDRGSFVQVFQQIVSERNDALDPKDKPSILKNLLNERDAARRRAGEAASDLNEYARLLEERRALLEAIANLQDRRDKAERQKRLRELALHVAPTWDERESRRAELAEMGDVPAVEQKSVDECDALIAAVSETNAKIKELRDGYRAKRDERDAIPVDSALAELAPRVSILEEDLPRLTEIDSKVSTLRKELEELNAKLAEEEQRLRSARNGKLVLTRSALDAINASIVSAKIEEERRNGATPAEISAAKLPNKLVEAGATFKEIEDYKIPAKRVRRARQRLQKRKAELEQIRTRLNALVAKLEEGLTSHGQKNLTEAIERSGALLSALRRRIEIEKRVDEMATYRKELERQNHTLVENQAIVGPPLYLLGAGVVVGGFLFGLSLFYDRVDLVAGLIGLLVMIGCIFYKTTVERKNRLKLEDNQRRLGLLTRQLEQARVETASLDEKYPAPANQPNLTLETRLQRAKADLAHFEGLAPVEAQWREATKLFRAQEEKVARSETAVKKSLKRWRAWLRAACLPETLKPKQVRDLFARVEIADDLRTQVATCATEIEYLGRERQGIVDRLDAAIALAPKKTFDDKSPFFVVPKLREMLDEHADVLKERATLLDEMNKIKRACKKLLAVRRRQIRETRRFLAGFNLHSRKELVEAVARRSLYCRRVADLDVVEQRLAAGIGGFCQEDEIAALLNDQEARADLVPAIDGLVVRIDALDSELKGKLELSGRLGQQADAIAAKKGSVRDRFDSVALDLRFERMAALWQSRAVAGQMMEDIRRAYEKERQPETLREASRYLKRLTDGLYVNIWTPLGEDALFVDAANGETLDVAALSRGTRELLFIAIRLALVVSFEKHGVQMPLIWDDVLVNFDYRRAAIAAKLLFEFAKAGRQIFLFTCHEHICRLFLRLGSPVCVLPTSTDPKRRKFRVLTPLKKRIARGEAELVVKVAKPVELGPNFVEKSPVETNATRFAVEGSDFDSLRYPTETFADEPVLRSGERYDLASQDDGETFTFDGGVVDDSVAVAAGPTGQGDYGVNPNAQNDERVFRADADLAETAGDPEIVADAEVVSVQTVAAINSVEPEPKSEESPRLDVTSPTFTALEEERVEYSPVKRDVAFDGGVASLSELSEISPVFTSKSSVKNAYEVSADLINPESNPDDAVEAVQEVEEGVDYVTVDESAFEDVDSPDFDEWTKVFTDHARDDDEPESGNFADYLVDASDDGAEVAESDEYSETDEDEEEYSEDEYEEEETDEYYDDEEDDSEDEEGDDEE